ncbi:hypothetical protein H0H92_006804 [Tricholoma furcatifolium]|nr:hypothetical protein H0H92_006804 [Tricholoma furcatifolium]
MILVGDDQVKGYLAERLRDPEKLDEDLGSMLLDKEVLKEAVRLFGPAVAVEGGVQNVGDVFAVLLMAWTRWGRRENKPLQERLAKAYGKTGKYKTWANMPMENEDYHFAAPGQQRVSAGNRVFLKEDVREARIALHGLTKLIWEGPSNFFDTGYFKALLHTCPVWYRVFTIFAAMIRCWVWKVPDFVPHVSLDIQSILWHLVQAYYEFRLRCLRKHPKISETLMPEASGLLSSVEDARRCAQDCRPLYTHLDKLGKGKLWLASFAERHPEPYGEAAPAAPWYA